MNAQLALKPVRDAVFRANPNYELVALDQLPAAQQGYLSQLNDLPDCFALLRPRTTDGLLIKSVGSETAQLFAALQEPGLLPQASHDQLAAEADPNRTLVELVLDGVLEISFAGAFVSGAEAYTAVYDAAFTLTADGHLARLSLQALQRAQLLPDQDSATISNYLYSDNRLPLSPYWTRRLPSADSVGSYLGLGAQTTMTRKLDKFWLQPNSRSDTQESGWRYWQARSLNFSADPAQAIYKLYISPLPTHLPEVFAEAIDVFAACEVQQFKIGKNVGELLRPDKLIVYVETLDKLHQVASSLCDRLAGIEAHGVPFTAELGLDGLLSWGMDPPSTEYSTAWKQRESWRLWICNRLAIALAEARRQPNASISAWQFALERLRLDGVDPSTWTPISGLWQSASSSEVLSGSHL